MSILRRAHWLQVANPGQTPPPEWRRTWYVQGGRGSGKTRTGAETLADKILTFPPGDWACVGPTFGDARDTMVEHRRSGLLKVLGAAVLNWNRSIGELYVANPYGGYSTVYCDGADDGADRIQGKELRGAWCDEVGLWKSWLTNKGEQKGGIYAWQQSIDFAVREAPALVIATGTPKGKKGVVKLLTEEPAGRVVFTFPSLADNEVNLEPWVVEDWRRRYGGTRLGQQELEGKILGDVEGALWNWERIEASRLTAAAYWWEMHIGRTVVAVDPAASSGDDSDETGIVTAQVVRGFDSDMAAAWGMKATPELDQAVVLNDRSGTYSPIEWARQAVEAYYEYGADRIVAEKNQGGEMVSQTIHTVDPNVPVTLVWASKGKQTRAEPVSALYEQGRVWHAEPFPELEAEQTSWVPGEASPNHMDALVWAITDLLLGARGGLAVPAPTTPGESLTSDLMNRVM